MAKESTSIRLLLKLLESLLVLISDSKSREDPAVKISIYGLRENPLVSLISTGGGIFNEKRVNKIVKIANRHK